MVPDFTPVLRIDCLAKRVRYAETLIAGRGGFWRKVCWRSTLGDLKFSPSKTKGWIAKTIGLGQGGSF